uniref:Apolipoprotein L domain-containing protein 1 n=1 Tax=Dicentrarchus labrax TaxID=13489 RepID=A0A8P4KIJ3_DICLA
MMPPKPPRKSDMIKSATTSSCDVSESVYEDPDASTPADTSGSQSEVKVKPVPSPRSIWKPKCPNTNNKTVESVETTSHTNSAVKSQLSPYPADYKRPQPVRPPPRPPTSKHLTSSKPTAAVEGGTRYLNLNTEPAVKPPAVSTDKIQPHPSSRPERPPLPSSYYDRSLSTMKPKSEIYTDQSPQSRRLSISSLRESVVSPVLCEEVVHNCGTYDSKTKPPLPPFKPPPPPATWTQSESVYSEIDYRPYLPILPEDGDSMSLGRSTLMSGQSGCFSSHQQTTSEDIYGMLRWLKRVSKSDFMAPSLYCLSIEEEIRSFNDRAMTVRKALRLYNLLMMKRNKRLRDIIVEFTSIYQSLDKMEKDNKTMGIAGGTTGAVGGVTAILGIALAPVTMGTSLIATAVGAGMVASAGGVGAHAAKANKKKLVNKMSVEKLVYEYKDNIVDLEQCLEFILSGMMELRRHDIARLQRAGAHPDALMTAHLSKTVINNERKGSVSHTGGMSSERLLQAFVKEIDQYFKEKEGQKLRKSNKSRFSARVRLLAENLQDDLDHLNNMWEKFT